MVVPKELYYNKGTKSVIFAKGIDRIKFVRSDLVLCQPAWVPGTDLPTVAGWYWSEIQFGEEKLLNVVFFNPHHFQGPQFEFYDHLGKRVIRYFNIPLVLPPKDGEL